MQAHAHPRSRSGILAIGLAAIALSLSSCGEDEAGAVTAGSAVDGAATDNDGANLLGADAEDGAGSADGVEGAGVGKPCAKTDDCPDGLQCAETNAATGDGICTLPCTTNADCVKGGFCHAVGKLQICTPAAWCDPCASDADCGPGTPLCVPGKDGKTFCSATCSLGDKTCKPGWSCEQYGSTIDDFACRPDYGSCSGGGEFCAPCQAEKDCGPGTVCATSPDTGERACFQKCTAETCASGFSCSPGGFCARKVPNEDPKKADTYVQTCAKDKRIYCDLCSADWQCASGRCATANGQSFCAQPTPCAKDNETKDCAEGTFCIGSDKGMICAPPLAWKCQGFKACLGKVSPCGAKEVCDNGLCKPK